MSVFDNRRNDVSDAIDEVYRTPAIILAADLTELSARSARLERERDEERAARLKAEAERDRAESHAKRAEDVAHGLQAQVLALRSLFVNFRWDGPAWIKPEEHRAMEEATRLAGGKPLDS